MDLITSSTDAEIAFIAALDYGQDAARHEEALRRVIREQHGRLEEGQHWFPYEVIELGAHQRHPGQDRVFVICTLLVIRAVLSGFDGSTDLAEKYRSKAVEYAMLPGDLAEAVRAGYAAALESDG